MAKKDASEKQTLYKVTTNVQKDGFRKHTPEDDPDPLEEFDEAWKVWAVANKIIVIVDGDAPQVEGETVVATDAPVYMEHWLGDPADAPEGTWEHKWRVEREAKSEEKADKAAEKAAKAPPKGASGDKE